MKWHKFDNTEEKTWPTYTGKYLIIRKNIGDWSYAWFDHYIGCFYESPNKWLRYTDVAYWLEVKMPENLPWPIDKEEEV